MAHYARDMEFYYLNKRPEILSGIVRTFDTEGGLINAERRLMLASFLSEVIRQDPSLLSYVLPPEQTLSRNGRHMLAWMVHLSDLPNRKQLLLTLLDSNDTALMDQLERSPRYIYDWNINTEITVQKMYWGAFMASGKNIWLDPIIKIAMRYGPLKAAGRQKDILFTISATAAATLYEWAPRHHLIQKRIKYFLKKATRTEAKVLNALISH